MFAEHKEGNVRQVKDCLLPWQYRFMA